MLTRCDWFSLQVLNREASQGGSCQAWSLSAELPGMRLIKDVGEDARIFYGGLWSLRGPIAFDLVGWWLVVARWFQCLPCCAW